MRSSIFSSDLGGPGRALAILLLLLVSYLAALEVATRWALPKVSAGWHRQTTDHAAARDLGRRAGADTVLVVGNSLLEAGILRDAFATAMAPQFEVAVYPIEATTYWDWYFGLRRLFAEGVHPRHVVLTMNVRQLLSNSTNGEPFARSMLQTRDLPALTRAAHLDPMTASNYFFASQSEWIGARASIRNALLERWLPDAPLLVAHFAGANRAAAPADPDLDLAIERLRALAALCAEHGATFQLLLPPSLNATDAAPSLVAAATGANLQVLMPFPPASLAATEFSDGFHLNAAGAARFTNEAASGLRRTLPAGKN
jgi:lysophospholipase L1-like esterase